MFGHVKDSNDRWERKTRNTVNRNRQNPCCWNCSHCRVTDRGDCLCIEETYYRNGSIYRVSPNGYCSDYIPSNYDSPVNIDV